MVSRAHDLVRQHFEACSTKLFSTGDKARVSELFAPVCNSPQVSEYCAAVLSPQEKQTAKGFSNSGDRNSFVQRRAFRRYFAARFAGPARDLETISFSVSKTGRPFLNEFPKTWFSFASSNSGFIAAQSSTHAVGVDMENRTSTEGNLEVARHFFTAHEADLIEALHEPERSRQFMRLWCIKEAALKSIGEGLPFGLHKFVLQSNLDQGFSAVPSGQGAPNDYSCYHVDNTDFCAAIVIRPV